MPTWNAKTMEQPKNKKAIIYCRVSTKEQVDEGNSLTTQEKACREYALKSGYGRNDTEIFIEEGESAKTTNRKKLMELMEYCRKNHKDIELLIFYSLDRLSRDTNDYTTLKAFFNTLKIKIASCLERIEDSPSGRFLKHILAAKSQLDNEERSLKCKGGMIEGVKAGRYVFGAPFGYKNGTVNGEKNIIIDDTKAHFVKQIFELLATGLYQPEAVRKIIIEEGARIGKKSSISKQYFHNIIRNKVYKGVIDSFGLGEIKGRFEPIISEELFDTVQTILNKKGKRKSTYKIDNPDFPLRGLVVSEKGHKLTGSWSKGNAKARMPYYNFKGLNGFNTKRDVLEDKFKSYLKDFEFKGEFAELLKDSLSINWEHRNLSNSQLKTKVERKIAELKARQQLIIDKNLKGIIDDDLAKEQLDNIKQEIVALIAKMKEYEGIDNIQDVLNYSLNFMQNLVTEIGKLKIQQRKNLQWFFFPDGIVYDGNIFRTHRTALILNTKMTSLCEKSSNVDRTGLEPAASSVQTRRSTR